MRSIIVFLLILSPIFLFAQKLNKIKKFSGPKNEIKEVYEILNNDSTIKNGVYKKYRNGSLIEDGFYLNNQKDGGWAYLFNGYTFISGMYKSGTKIGLWRFSANGKIVQTFNFNDSSVMDMIKGELIPRTKVEMRNINGDVEVNATILGGELCLIYKIINDTVYPNEAFKMKLNANVPVEFVIEKDGSISNVKSKSFIGNGFDEAAEEVIRNLDLIILPATQNGNPVRVQYSVPVRFNYN